MFHFPSFASYDYEFIARYQVYWWVSPFGNPRINACYGSPRLIAVIHVLHRFLVPRHPPQALSSLKYLFDGLSQLKIAESNLATRSGFRRIKSLEFEFGTTFT